jgi:hypothetical protein
MSALITDQFRIFLSKQFISSFDTSLQIPNSLYVFVGRPQPWESSTGGDSNPPDPIDSFEQYSDIYDDSVAMKRILPTDILPVIRRIDWTPPERTTGGLGFTYDMYRHDYSVYNPSSSGSTSLYEADFYVMNSQYQIFKCIYNGTSPSDPNGKPSTIEPTGTSNSIITTADGYRWKYMYSLAVDQIIRFLSRDFLPVIQDESVSSNTNSGEIDTVLIINAGSGYNNGVYENIPINGDGSGGRVTIVVDGGKVSQINVLNGGSNYSFAQIDIDGITGIGSGTGSQLQVIIPPIGGHGKDPITELGAFRILINTQFSYDEGFGDFPTDNDFRRIGLIINPLVSGTSTIATKLTYSLTKAIAFPLSFNGAFTPDSTIEQRRTIGVNEIRSRGVVISWNPITKVLKYFQNRVRGIFPEGTGSLNRFTGSENVSIPGQSISVQPDISFPEIDNTETRSVDGKTYNLGQSFTQGYSDSEIEKNSGKIIYIDNRRPIVRFPDQVEDIKIVIEF